ncbi:hypothetical protein [Coleofasciculus sp. FACHB-129]|uniref:hypothetical protein n=1 Tax=Coleofasciculus sp. FACHB-129 TaxID=2692785 RepID=UPI0016831DC5|nr:hypothetical protein [Coleofasciculus sp. FACHB-129]MBD1893094.1 hypothetical protein [Coleofasciculus sp. FACHB-129]
MVNTLIAPLVAIAALDSLNPTATAIQVYLLSTPKPIARSVLSGLKQISSPNKTQSSFIG